MTKKCMYCRRILRGGTWRSIVSSDKGTLERGVTHGICPDCVCVPYSEFDDHTLRERANMVIETLRTLNLDDAEIIETLDRSARNGATVRIKNVAHAGLKILGATHETE